MELLLAPRAGIPRVEISLLFPAGAELDPIDRPGLASLTGALLDEGTTRRSGTELAEELEGLGATLSTGADWNTGHADLALFSRDLERGLRALADVTLEPAFPEAEVERLRRQTLAEIQRRRDQPGLLADEALADQLYRGTPYGALRLGTRASLEAVERSQITAFHAGGYRASRAKLVAAGEFDPDRLLGLAQELFGRSDAAST